MKKIIFSLAAIFIFVAAHAQTEKDLIGKWKLVSFKNVEGKVMDIKALMKTDEVYQVFKEGNEVEGIIGEKTQKGTWKLSADNKSYTVTVGGVSSVFKQQSFDADKRVVTLERVGTLEYAKK